MRKGVKLSVVPVVVAISALFLALPTTGASTTVKMVAAATGWRFSPASSSAARGARIAFTNNSRVTHTATCDGCGWDTGDVQPGQTVFINLPDAGTFQFYCRYHAQTFAMTGTVVVGGGPPPPTGAPTVTPTP